MQPTYYARDPETIVAEDGDVAMVTDADYCEAILAAWTYLWRLQWAERAALCASASYSYEKDGNTWRARQAYRRAAAASLAARLQHDPARWLP